MKFTCCFYKLSILQNLFNLKKLLYNHASHIEIVNMNESIEKKLDSFFFNFKKIHFKKGEIIIQADEVPQYIYYLKSGVVRQYMISEKGSELVLNIFKPLAFFPMSHALNNKPSVYYFESLNDVTLYRAPKDTVLDFIRQNPDIQYDLLVRLFKGIDGLLSRMAYLMSANAHKRLIAEILLYNKRFFQTEPSTKSITIDINEHELASLTGLTRETVSRELKVLKNKELISFAKRKLTISDLALLESELSSSD